MTCFIDDKCYSAYKSKYESLYFTFNLSTVVNFGAFGCLFSTITSHCHYKSIDDKPFTFQLVLKAHHLNALCQHRYLST